MKPKTKLIILTLAGIAVILAYAALRPTATDSYESFNLAMDRWAGPGQWSVQSHDSSSSGLTVKGLNIKLPLSLSGRADGQPSVLTADSVLIKKIPPKSQLEKLLALANWQGQPETLLAEAVNFKGIRQEEPRAEGIYEVRIGEFNLGGIKLAGAPSSAPAGADGFLKALRLDSLGYKNFNLTIKGPEASASAAVDSATFGGLALGGEVHPELIKLDPTGFLERFGVLSFKSLKSAGLKMDFKGLAPEAPIQGSLSLAALEEVDVDPLKSVGSIKMKGLEGRFTDDEGRVSSLSLADFSLKGLDAADYMNKLMAGLAAAQDADGFETLFMTDQFTLADFFVSPISLEETTATGFKLDLAGLISIKMAEMKAAGPYKAGQIPVSAKSLVKGLEINLSGDSKAEKGAPGRDIYELAQNLGRNALTLNIEADSAYNAQTGLFTTRLNRLEEKDLFDLALSFTWGGLTADRLEKFSKIPLNAFYLAALNPDELLGNASFNALNIKYTDRGLVDLVFKLKAKDEGRSGAELKQETTAAAGLLLPMMAARFVKNVEDLSRPIMAFLQSPKSLEIDLKAAPPLTFAVVQNLDADTMAILDALNITISANGQAGSPLRFAIGQ